MSVRRIQRTLAAVFVVLGGWCLLAPASVLHLTITEPYRVDAPIVRILIGAFGAQAWIAALFINFSTLTSRTFLAYGIALLPFFVFDYWFYAIVPVFTAFGMLDAVGNAIMLVLCYLGWTTMRDAEAHIVAKRVQRFSPG